jgi:hypothetical protein
MGEFNKFRKTWFEKYFGFKEGQQYFLIDLRVSD